MAWSRLVNVVGCPVYMITLIIIFNLKFWQTIIQNCSKTMIIQNIFKTMTIQNRFSQETSFSSSQPVTRSLSSVGRKQPTSTSRLPVLGNSLLRLHHMQNIYLLVSQIFQNCLSSSSFTGAHSGARSQPESHDLFWRSQPLTHPPVQIQLNE